MLREVFPQESNTTILCLAFVWRQVASIAIIVRGNIYLRLGVDDLRGVALPAPSSIAHRSAPQLVPARSLPRVRAPRPSRDLPKRFHSSLASSLQRFLDLKTSPRAPLSGRRGDLESLG
jgi:hypothetical protein